MPNYHAPRVDHWPPALRSAAIRAGTLVPCGPGFRPITWPETPTTRAVAIAEHLLPRYVASGETAAWIWGACRSPGVPLRFAMRRGRPPLHQSEPLVTVHEYRFEEGEFVTLADHTVTTRMRTAYDLLRSTEAFTLQRRVACRLLIARSHERPSSLTERASRSSKSDAALVTRRLVAMYGDPGVRSDWELR